MVDTHQTEDATSSSGARFHLPAVVVTFLILLLELVVLFGASVSLGWTEPESPTDHSGRVILVGSYRVVWENIDRPTTPTLFGAAALGGVASLSPRTATERSCMPDAWLTISAGRRATASCAGFDAQATGDGEPATVGNWQQLVDLQDEQHYVAAPGLLGDAAGAAGRTVCVIGRTALLGGADSSGTVPVYYSSMPSSLPDSCAVTLITVPDLERGAHDLAQMLADDDTTTDVYLAGLAASDDDSHPVPDDTPQLQVIAHYVHGQGIATSPEWLTSASTRWTGMVQLTDLTPTLLTAAGIAVPDDVVGSPILSGEPRSAGGISADKAIAEMVETNTRAGHSVIAGWIAVGIAVAFALVVTLVEGRRIRSGHSRSVARGVVLVAASAVALTPVATYVTRWVPITEHLPAEPQLVISTLLIAAAGCAAVLWWVGREHRSPTAAATLALSGIIMVVLGLDTLSGGHLQQATPFGNDPLLGGRFYGMRNLTFGLFGAATLMAAAAAGRLFRAQTTLAVRAVLMIGLAGVAVDGLPSSGADVGGMLSLAPGVVLLALLVGGVRLTVPRLVGVLVSGVVLFVLAGLADHARPPEERTHVGQFAERVLQGESWPVILRKIDDNIHAVGSPYLALVLAVVLVAIGLVLSVPGRVGRVVPGALAGVVAPVTSRLVETYEALPEIRHGVLAVMLSAVIAIAVNDSGVTLGPAFLLALVPILLAAVALRPRSNTSARSAV